MPKRKTSSTFKKRIHTVEDGHIQLIGEVIRDGLKHDPYWFFSPWARMWCNIGGLHSTTCKELYYKSLARNSDLIHIKFRSLNHFNYGEFRKVAFKANRKRLEGEPYKHLIARWEYMLD